MILAIIHMIHGIFPFLYKKRIHTLDDGDPTPRQQKILNKTGDGYFTHLLLNFFLGYNHIRVNQWTKIGKTDFLCPKCPGKKPMSLLAKLSKIENESAVTLVLKCPKNRKHQLEYSLYLDDIDFEV